VEVGYVCVCVYVCMCVCVCIRVGWFKFPYSNLNHSTIKRVFYYYN